MWGNPNNLWTLKAGSALIWAGLFVKGLMQYPGSQLIYTVFSLVFLVILLSGFYRPAGYGYAFLVVFLWLGFWLKLVVHLILLYPFVEPVGRFMFSSAQWDEVLMVATIGGIGVLIGRVLFLVFARRSTMLNVEISEAPRWYASVRWRLWFLLVVCVLVAAVANMVYGFQQSGLVPRTILGWHLNGLIYYALSVGFSLCVTTLLWWDVSLNKNIFFNIVILLLEGFVSTVSLLSRGIFIFNVVPQLVALYKNRTRLMGYTRIKASFIVIFFALLVLLSFQLVNMLRNHYYSGSNIDYSLGFGASSHASELHLVGVNVDKLLRFSVDRWIGLEGTMAMVAYPDKGRKTFFHALDEDSKNGQGMMYQAVSASYYAKMDMSKFRFTSLPGSIAFFYYSGSLWVVCSGMLFFTLLILFGEYKVFHSTNNPIMSAFFGASLANVVSQFGVSPINVVPYLAVLVLGPGLIRLLQSKWLDCIVQRLDSRVS